MDENESTLETEVEYTTRTIKFPPAQTSWFSPERVHYLSELLQFFLFALAVPYLLFRLVRDPAGTFRGASAVHAQ